MAKGQRLMIGLTCSECKIQNYITTKNKTNSPEKLVLRKYCPTCGKKTDHKESTKFK